MAEWKVYKASELFPTKVEEVIQKVDPIIEQVSSILTNFAKVAKDVGNLVTVLPDLLAQVAQTIIDEINTYISDFRRAEIFILPMFLRWGAKSRSTERFINEVAASFYDKADLNRPIYSDEAAVGGVVILAGFTSLSGFKGISAIFSMIGIQRLLDYKKLIEVVFPPVVRLKAYEAKIFEVWAKKELLCISFEKSYAEEKKREFEGKKEYKGVEIVIEKNAYFEVFAKDVVYFTFFEESEAKRKIEQLKKMWPIKRKKQIREYLLRFLKKEEIGEIGLVIPKFEIREVFKKIFVRGEVHNIWITDASRFPHSGIIEVGGEKTSYNGVRIIRKTIEGFFLDQYGNSRDEKTGRVYTGPERDMLLNVKFWRTHKAGEEVKFLRVKNTVTEIEPSAKLTKELLTGDVPREIQVDSTKDFPSSGILEIEREFFSYGYKTETEFREIIVGVDRPLFLVIDTETKELVFSTFDYFKADAKVQAAKKTPYEVTVDGEVFFRTHSEKEAKKKLESYYSAKWYQGEHLDIVKPKGRSLTIRSEQKFPGVVRFDHFKEAIVRLSGPAVPKSTPPDWIKTKAAGTIPGLGRILRYLDKVTSTFRPTPPFKNTIADFGLEIARRAEVLEELIKRIKEDIELLRNLLSVDIVFSILRIEEKTGGIGGFINRLRAASNRPQFGDRDYTAGIVFFGGVPRLGYPSPTEVLNKIF